jgi:hypothetical protein
VSKIKTRRGSPTGIVSGAGIHLRGKVSQFGGPNDPTDSGHTANGMTTATPGIAVYNENTLGGYWKVTTANGRTQVIQQTDIGPAPWTGRLIDFTYSAVHLFGYTQQNFPTDSVASAVYLGKDKQKAMEAGGQDAIAASQQVTSGGETAGIRKNASIISDGEGAVGILKDLVTGNVSDLGSKLALASLSIVKDFAVGFADLIVAPAWHWNQRATAYYSGYVLDPRRVADKTEYQWAFAWTAAFWGVGYVLLYTGEGEGLKPAPANKSRLSRHVRRAQALPARKSLIKPGRVKEHTPDKPKPVVSSTLLYDRGTMSTTRTRRVKVHGSIGRASEQEREAVSAVPIERVPAQADRHTKPNPVNSGGKRAPSNKRPATAKRSTPRRRQGHRT